MNQGGLAHLDGWLARHSEARLVVVDTLGLFRPVETGRESAYQADYAIGAALKPISDRHNVAMMLSHHTRKQEASDVLDSISGTQGLAGSVDAVLILRRERGHMDAALYVTGRDIEHEQDYALEFNADTCAWRSLGTVREARLSKERVAVLDFLKRHGPSKPKDIAEGIQKKQGTTRKLLHDMFKAGDVFVFNGLYSHISPLLLGNGGNTSDLGDGCDATEGTSATNVTAVTGVSREAYRAAKDGEA